MYSPEEIENAIQSHLQLVRANHSFSRKYIEETPSLHELTGVQIEAMKDSIFNKLILEYEKLDLTTFDRFLFWMSEWWHWNKDLESLSVNQGPICDHSKKLATNFIFSVLPISIQEIVREQKCLNVAVNSDKFAFLIQGRDSDTRLISTNTQLFEINNVKEYF